MSTTDRCPNDAAPTRVLIAVHGYEREGWPADAVRAAAAWPGGPLRVLGVHCVPSAPVTSPGAFARRAYRAARTQLTALEAARLRAPISALISALPREAEVVHVRTTPGRAGRSIAEHVRAWSADVVVVGRPVRGLDAWLHAGAVHAGVVRHAPCIVVVTPPAPARPRVARGFVPSPAAAGHEA
jgi:nucleotide-binding universal stress UspA family protein